MGDASVSLVAVPVARALLRMGRSMDSEPASPDEILLAVDASTLSRRR